MRTVDLPPYAPTLMESTRAIGYSIEAAIADIVDNSISAFAGQVDIDFFHWERLILRLLMMGLECLVNSYLKQCSMVAKILLKIAKSMT